MSINQPNVVPTNIALLLGRIDGKIDTLITKTDAHEVRILKLEDKSGKFEGAIRALKWAWVAIAPLLLWLGYHGLQTGEFAQPAHQPTTQN